MNISRGGAFLNLRTVAKSVSIGIDIAQGCEDVRKRCIKGVWRGGLIVLGKSCSSTASPKTFRTGGAVWQVEQLDGVPIQSGASGKTSHTMAGALGRAHAADGIQVMIKQLK